MNGAKRLDEEGAAEIPEIRDIIQLRNIIVHGYAVVENVTIWVAVHGVQRREFSEAGIFDWREAG